MIQSCYAAVSNIIGQLVTAENQEQKMGKKNPVEKEIKSEEAGERGEIHKLPEDI